MEPSKVLIVEDDPTVQNLICTIIETTGLEYVLAGTGKEALKAMEGQDPALILMDLGLPDVDGIEVIEKIRQISYVPILVISARNQEADKIEALDAGADDYITKPFQVNEMLARIRALLRRSRLLDESKKETKLLYKNGNLKIDYLSKKVWFHEQELHLTPIEYKILELLAQNTGKVVTSSWMTKQIWHTCWDSDLSSLRVYMAMLRKKLKEPDQSVQYIQTRIGVGYQMNRMDESQEAGSREEQ